MKREGRRDLTHFVEPEHLHGEIHSAAVSLSVPKQTQQVFSDSIGQRVMMMYKKENARNELCS